MGLSQRSADMRVAMKAMRGTKGDSTRWGGGLGQRGLEQGNQ